MIRYLWNWLWGSGQESPSSTNNVQQPQAPQSPQEHQVSSTIHQLTETHEPLPNQTEKTENEQPKLTEERKESPIKQLDIQVPKKESAVSEVAVNEGQMPKEEEKPKSKVQLLATKIQPFVKKENSSQQITKPRSKTEG